MNQTKQLAKDIRVGFYINPDTRDRLNKLKAEVLIATGRTISHDEAMTMLMDHFAATAPELDRVVAG